MLGGVRGRGLAAPSYSIQSAEFTSETSSFGGGLSDPVLSVPSLFTPLEFLFQWQTQKTLKWIVIVPIYITDRQGG